MAALYLGISSLIMARERPVQLLITSKPNEMLWYEQMRDGMYEYMLAVHI